ncbi:MAG: hypothetical protein GXO48_08120 [Chlorobi bacterium]|nr:hypothetical protein [Chlorobiota bacterium]
MPNNEKINDSIAQKLRALELRIRNFLRNYLSKFQRTLLINKWQMFNLPMIPFTIISRDKTICFDLYDTAINSQHTKGSMRILFLPEILLLNSFSQSSKKNAINLDELTPKQKGKRDKTLLVHIMGFEILNDNPKQIISRAKKKIETHYDGRTAEFYDMLIDCLLIKVSKRVYANITCVNRLFVHNNYVHISLCNTISVKANPDIIKESCRKALLTLDKLNSLYPDKTAPFYANLRYILSMWQDESAFKALRSGR